MTENKIMEINKMPSPTWSWLKMNKAEVSLGNDIENFLPDFKVGAGVVYNEAGFEGATELPELSSGTGIVIDDNYIPVGISVPAGKKISEPVVLTYNFAARMTAYTGQVIKAGKDSELTVIILSSSDDNAQGQQIVDTKIFADDGAKVRVIKVQLLGNNFVQLDDTASYVSEKAYVDVVHVVLGGKETYVGVGSNLKGYKSSFNSELAYYCRNEQILDMNYVVLQYGKKSECCMNVRGTVTDKSKKTYRGTIDFKQGCAGAVGQEQEETLILSPDVVNNSIPVILCDEEDVSGEHGASIGRLGDDVLFYMQSRGIDAKSAERVLARAKVQAVVSMINDADVTEKTEHFMNEIFGAE